MSEKIVMRPFRIDASDILPAMHALQRARGFLPEGALFGSVVILLGFLTALDLGDGARLGVLIGVAFTIAAFTLMNNLIYRRLLAVEASNPLREEHMTFSADAAGIEMVQPSMRAAIAWRGVTDFIDLKNALGLRTGLYVFVLPDRALPAGMGRSEFRARLEALRASATRTAQPWQKSVAAEGPAGRKGGP